MRDIIKATLGGDHFIKCQTYTIARNGEGLTPCLSVAIPENLCKYWAYIDFKKPNGETFKTPRIDVVEGILEYNIPCAVLDVDGKLYLQIIFQNELGEIWKSYVKEFVVRESINAVDDIPKKEDFITEAQKVIDEAEATAKSIEERANNGEFDGKDAIAELHYNPKSENAQSGLAVAEAISQSGIINSTMGESILLKDSKNAQLQSLKVYGKSTQDGTPTPEAPIPIVSAGANGSVEVKVCGTNLFNANCKYDPLHYKASAEALENGRVIKATSGLETWSLCCTPLFLVGGLTYTIAFDNITSTGTSTLAIRRGKGNDTLVQLTNNRKSYTFTAENGIEYYLFLIINSTGNTLTEPVIATYEGLRIIAGSTVVPWEEYKEPQTLTLATPNELRAVPIRSSHSHLANYIDASGKPWICDYIDIERGMLVQYVVSATLSGDDLWTRSGEGDTWYEAKHPQTNVFPITTPQTTQGGYSNLAPHGSLQSGNNSFNAGWGVIYLKLEGTWFGKTKPTLEDIKALLNEKPLTVYSYIDTPIETPLTAEEIAYYKALHTNYPNTTIFNSDGTNMDVSYVADTKLYIDNKFAELQALALEG